LRSLFLESFGHAAEPKRETIGDWRRLTSQQGRYLLDIVDDRHGRGSMIVTSQIPIKHWHELIADPTIADAVLDRVVHTAHRLELDGPSLRDPKATTAAPPTVATQVIAELATKPAKRAKK
jgi:hypothetical protein